MRITIKKAEMAQRCSLSHSLQSKYGDSAAKLSYSERERKKRGGCKKLKEITTFNKIIQFKKMHLI